MLGMGRCEDRVARRRDRAGEGWDVQATTGHQTSLFNIHDRAPGPILPLTVT
jgi:hypothetical protein